MNESNTCLNVCVWMLMPLCMNRMGVKGLVWMTEGMNKKRHVECDIEMYFLDSFVYFMWYPIMIEGFNYVTEIVR